MLSPYEKAKLPGVFRGPDADAVVRAAAAFANDGDPYSLRHLESALKPYDSAR
jgi:hypothetical protein